MLAALVPSLSRCAPRLSPLPASIEGRSRLVQIDDQRSVIGGQRFAFARLAIDLCPHASLRGGARCEEVIDAHPEVLVEISGAVVPPGEPPRLGVMLPVDVDQPPGA